MNELKLRKANIKDLSNVIEVVKAAIEEMNKNDILQWDDLYPNKDILMQDIL